MGASNPQGLNGGLAPSHPYIKELIETGELSGAVSYLKAYEFFNRGKKEGYQAALKILSISAQSRFFKEAIEQTYFLEKYYPKQFVALEGRKFLAELYFLSGQFESTLALLQNEMSSDLKAAAQLARHPESSTTALCDTPSLCAQLKESQWHYQQQSKNEAWGAILGVIPGLGHVYAHDYSGGIIQFLTVSFFAGLSSYAFNQNEKAFGFALAAVGGVNYFSGIYAGYQATAQWNDNQRRELQNTLGGKELRLRVLELPFN